MPGSNSQVLYKVKLSLCFIVLSREGREELACLLATLGPDQSPHSQVGSHLRRLQSFCLCWTEATCNSSRCKTDTIATQVTCHHSCPSILDTHATHDSPATPESVDLPSPAPARIPRTVKAKSASLSGGGFPISFGSRNIVDLSSLEAAKEYFARMPPPLLHHQVRT